MYFERDNPARRVDTFPQNCNLLDQLNYYKGKKTLNKHDVMYIGSCLATYTARTSTPLLIPREPMSLGPSGNYYNHYYYILYGGS